MSVNEGHFYMPGQCAAVFGCKDVSGAVLQPPPPLPLLTFPRQLGAHKDSGGALLLTCIPMVCTHRIRDAGQQNLTWRDGHRRARAIFNRSLQIDNTKRSCVSVSSELLSNLCQPQSLGSLLCRWICPK